MGKRTAQLSNVFDFELVATFLLLAHFDMFVCAQSDFERVPGTKQGEKGSCRPKGSKKK